MQGERYRDMPDSEATAFAIVGLGRIGGGLAHQGLERGFRVVGADTSGPPDGLVALGLDFADPLERIAAMLPAPRVVLLYVPAGAAVDSVIDGLAGALEDGDVIVDGGNSYWGDSLRRQRRLSAEGLGFVDLGTSGGVPGARHGACFMAGGEREDVAKVEPVLRALSVAGGYVHAGGPGAGHFVKLVHNGIEFGMLQAIAEGVGLLEAYGERLPVADVLGCWRNGSVIRSWLVELMEEAYRGEGGLGAVPPHVEDTGEVNWLVGDALEMEVAIPVIAQSVMALLASRGRADDAGRAVAMMRNRFGGHPFGPDRAVAEGRGKARRGGFPRRR